VQSVEVIPRVHRLLVGTPFGVGHVNAFLLEGSPLTLVDGGPNVATALFALERMIKSLGYQLHDIELLLITHQHVDHEGLTALLAERTGAEVVCLRQVADYVTDFTVSQLANDTFAQRLMRRHGLDAHVVDALGSVAGILRGLGASVAVTRILEDGDRIEAGGRRLRVLHRPGHSPSDTVFYDEDGGLLVCGDHLLSKISSNALITETFLGGDAVRTRPLLDYRRSLIATSELDVSVGLGGHGNAVTDHRALIAQRLSGQQRKAERIHKLLLDRPQSAHELARCLFGDVAFTEAFLTLSEVLGHLDLLIDDGLVEENHEDAIIGFRAV
jgi:glyoxylase-like metal-dependent hydrolase (beta-lactamase superfamily II)